MSLDDFGLPQWLVLAVAVQRVAELAVARRNTAHLIAMGGIEVGRNHYPFIVALHAAWLLAIFTGISPNAFGNLWLIGVFLLLQIARIWIIVSLGRYWTTRIISLPQVPLIKRGPYRWLRHPNYAIVALEIALLPLAFGNWLLFIVFSIANAVLMCVRIPLENKALALRRQMAAPPTTGSH